MEISNVTSSSVLDVKYESADERNTYNNEVVSETYYSPLVVKRVSVNVKTNEVVVVSDVHSRKRERVKQINSKIEKLFA